MSKRKDKVFDTIKHGPFEVEIRLSKNGIFSCEFGGEDFTSAELQRVKDWGYKRLRETSALEWKPILEVNFSVEDENVNNLRNVSNLACHIERYYIAWDGKKWMQTPWVVMPPNSYMCCGPQPSEMKQEDHPMEPEMLMQQRIRHAHPCSWAKSNQHLVFPFIEPERFHSTVYYVPHDEVTWETMLGLLDKMRELRTRLADMLTTSKGWGQLAALAGVKLLAAPEEEKKA